MIWRARRRGATDRGFTLIETLVSLAIATVTISGFYSALSTGALLDKRANAQAEQMFVATNIMDRVGIDIPVRAGTSQTGALQGLDWTLAITERPTPDMQLGPVQRGELVYIFVTVAPSNTDGTPVVLRAIRYLQSPL